MACWGPTAPSSWPRSRATADIAFNLKLINSLADAEAMADAMADVFYEALMAQLIDRKRIQVKPAGAQDPILG
jgi:hypothetical protein